MWISRVRVNGGFLAGLDIQLTEGLNVVIGPRGAGKTTVLELIRHALGVPHPDSGTGKKQSAMIRELLGSGEVIVDIEDQFVSHHLVVDAVGQGRDSTTSSMALVLGQNELEQIASSAQSRLSLIDLRAGTQIAPPSKERAGELTSRMALLRSEMEKLAAAEVRRKVVLKDREQAARREQDLLMTASAELAARRAQLQLVEDQVLQVAQQQAVGESLDAILQRAYARLEPLRSDVTEIGSIELGVELSTATDEARRRLAAALQEATRSLAEIDRGVARNRSSLASRSDELRAAAEPIRAELEAAEAGLGQVTAEVRNLDAELARLDRDVHRLGQFQDLYIRTRVERDELLDEYEAWQEDVYAARLAIANQVSQDLGQHVAVDIEHLSQIDGFRDALIELLQGSGLQYRPMANKLVETVLPRQLLSLVETQDSEQLASISGIPVDRAVRVLAALDDTASIRRLALTQADDKVDFLLLSPTGPKPVERLSTGQKCAVTLPIALTEQNRALVLDQPEDHLDNGYLVSNVLTALETRTTSGAQTIVATHNANIPVLGSATKVIALASDGEHGFVDASGSYEEPAIVSKITTIMEGGRQAFLDRAAFYSEHENNIDG